MNQLHTRLKSGESTEPYKQIIEVLGLKHDNALMISISAIFLLDWLSPLGYSVWLLYLIPLIISSLDQRKIPFFQGVIITFLIICGYFLSPPGVNPNVAIVNRSVGIMVIWIMMAIINQNRQLISTLKVKEAERDVEYHTLFNLIDEGFCLLEMIYDENENPIDWRFLETNPAFENQNGLYEAKGKRICELVSDLEPFWFKIYGEVDRTGEPIRFENQAKALDSRWFDLYAFRIGNQGSYKVAVIFKDISVSKQADATKIAAIQYTRSLIEASLDPLVTINAEGKITDVNEASVLATGVPSEQLVGTDFCDYFTEPVKAREGYQKVFSDGFVRDYPLAIRHVSGRIMDVLYNASVYKDDNGIVLGVFAAARDVTHQKQLNWKLEEKNVELEASMIAAEKANLAKSDFLSHMSHELRTPLNAILGFAQLLETGKPSLTDIQAIRLNQILKAGWYLLNLINEILDLAMIESGKMSISLKPVPLSTILSECQLMLEPQAQKSDINLCFLLPDSTWYVHADQTKLKQVLINLLSNAIKYNRKNGNVEVWCSEGALGRLRITIKDSGSGISMNKMEQLFQPFNRLGHEVGTKEGAGIGLAVTKKLVEIMGGTIGSESTVGVGSEFWIELDRVVISQPTALIGFPDELVSQHKNDAASYTMLYVEDNPASLMLVEHIIGDYPHIRMLSAFDGIRAIAIAQEQLPDIILMDINLPNISGIETMTLLREDPATKHIPIIALSANAMPLDINIGLEAGFSSYITKPIKNTELLEALDEAIFSRRKEQESAKI